MYWRASSTRLVRANAVASTRLVKARRSSTLIPGTWVGSNLALKSSGLCCHRSKTVSANSTPFSGLFIPSSSRATSDITTSYRLPSSKASASWFVRGVSTVAPYRRSRSTSGWFFSGWSSTHRIRARPRRSAFRSRRSSVFRFADWPIARWDLSSLLRTASVSFCSANSAVKPVGLIPSFVKKGTRPASAARRDQKTRKASTTQSTDTIARMSSAAPSSLASKPIASRSAS